MSVLAIVQEPSNALLSNRKNIPGCQECAVMIAVNGWLEPTCCGQMNSIM